MHFARLVCLKVSFAILFEIAFYVSIADLLVHDTELRERRLSEDKAGHFEEVESQSLFYGTSEWTTRPTAPVSSGTDTSGNSTISAIPADDSEYEPRQKIYILALMSFTESSDILALVFKSCVGIQLDGIMDSGKFFPGYELIVEWYDDQNMNQATAMMEALSRPDRKYAFVLGPDWRMHKASPLAVAARIPQVSVDSGELLADRKLYPFALRALPAKQGAFATEAWFMRTNGWQKFILVSNRPGVLKYRKSIYDAWGLEPLLLDTGETAKERYGELWQKQVEALIRSTRVRIITMDGLGEMGYLAMFCYLYRQRIRHMVHLAGPVAFGFWVGRPNTWWADEQIKKNEPPCTFEELCKIFNGLFQVVQNVLTPGVRVMGEFIPPLPEEFGGDLSDIQLSCFGDVTTGMSYYNDFSNPLRAISEGLPISEAKVFYSRAGYVSDTLCIIALALHEALHVRKMSLAQIEERSPSTYLELMEILLTRKFYGLQGYVELDASIGAMKPNWFFIMQPDYIPPLDKAGIAMVVLFQTGDFTDTESVSFLDYRNVDAYIEIVLPDRNWENVSDWMTKKYIGMPGTVGIASSENSILAFYPDCMAQNSILVDTDCVPCGVGLKFDSLLGSCRPCDAGMYQDAAGQSECKNCPGGMFAALEGSTGCEQCPLGTVCVAGSKTPEPCEAGEQGILAEPMLECRNCHCRFALNAGIRSIEQCASYCAGGGRYRFLHASGDKPDGSKGNGVCYCCNSTTTHEGDLGEGLIMYSIQADCARCPKGRFQVDSGQTTCTSCETLIPGSTTDTRGSLDDRDCICAFDTYLYRSSASDPNGSCVPCLEGLFCNGGVGPCEYPNYSCRGTLLQDERFHAGEPEWEGGKPSFIVECASKYKCPKGRTLAKGCPTYRTGLACDLCIVDYVDQGAQGCKSCAEQGAWYLPIVLMSIATIIGVICLYMFASREVSVQYQTLVTVGLTFSLTINVVQALGAFNELTVDWIDPMRTIGSVLKLLTFRVDFMNLECLLKNNSPALKYLASLMMYPIFASVLTACLIIARSVGRPITLAKSLNVHGLVYMIAYLALSIVSVLPWQCELNPDDSMSVASSRTVQCFESGEHTAMVIMSVIGFLFYGVGFIALVVWATIVYPSKVMQESGVDFVQQFQFIFARFTADRYYYGVVYVTRNLLIALLPVIFVNEPQIQLMTMALLIVGVAIMQGKMWPWRTVPANVLDAGFALLLTMTLVAGCMLMDLNTEQGRNRLQIILIIVFVTTFASSLALVGYLVVQSVCRGRQFGMFLCHHKGGAAVLARWFKELMTPYTSDRIFLDSDELDRLDLIFSVIAFDTKNVVILLTSETLLRMWCAGEIASAIRCKVNTVPVTCDDYEQPTDEFLQILGDQWSSSQKAELYALGVDISHIETAYRRLREIEPLPLQRRGNMARTHDTTAKVLQRCKNLSLTTTSCMAIFSKGGGSKGLPSGDLAHQSTNLKGADIVMTGNTTDVEASATCQVVQMLLQRQMQISVSCLCVEEDFHSSFVEGTLYLLVVLSRDILANPKFGNALVRLLASGSLEVVPLQADQTFVYPSPAFWKEFDAGSMLNPAELARTVTLQHVAAAYKILFTKLALRFSPHGSNRIQRVEIADMIPRFRALKAGPGKAQARGQIDALPEELLRSLDLKQWDKGVASGSSVNYQAGANGGAAVNGKVEGNGGNATGNLVSVKEDIDQRTLSDMVKSEVTSSKQVDLPWEDSREVRLTPPFEIGSLPQWRHY